MERPAAPAPPRPCRPILDEDPLFPRYKIRGVLAAGTRRPQRFQSQCRGPGWCRGTLGFWPLPPRPGPEGDVAVPAAGTSALSGRGQEEGPGSGARRGGCSQWKSEVSPWGVEEPGGWSCWSVGALPRWEKLLMLRSPPISGRRGRRRWRRQHLGRTRSS